MKFHLILVLCLFAPFATAQHFRQFDVRVATIDDIPANNHEWTGSDTTSTGVSGSTTGFAGYASAAGWYGMLRGVTRMDLADFPFDQAIVQSKGLFVDQLFIAATGTTAVLESTYTIGGTYQFAGFASETVTLTVDGTDYAVTPATTTVVHARTVDLNAWNQISGELSMEAIGLEAMNGSHGFDLMNATGSGAILSSLRLFESDGVTPIADWTLQSESGHDYLVPEPTTVAALSLGFLALVRRKRKARVA
jgi:hypothetical protein